ncbi:MAG: hypothetical protein ACRD37_13465, partial [Candidatus Acidiferrales bacterium]
MQEQRKFKAIKGVRDILPPATELWNWFEKTARGVMEAYNFGEIRLPIFEETELFARSIGVETDVVNKEMYSFEVHESDELVERRYMVVNWPWDFDQFHGFKMIALHFAENVKSALDKGQIPRDSFNVRVFEQIAEATEDLQHRSPQYGKDTARRLQEAARVLQIGESTTLRPEATASVVRAY